MDFLASRLKTSDIFTEKALAIYWEMEFSGAKIKKIQ